MDHAAVAATVNRVWDDSLPVLSDYIRIPAVSSLFVPDWAERGHIDEAVSLLRAWAGSRAIEGMTVEVATLPGRTPVIVCEVPATGGGGGGGGGGGSGDTVLLYGHLDKQPEMVGWRDGLGPWEPVIDGDLLYGRGGADDGYSIFAAIGAIEAVRAGGGSHARCVVLIEASEESGSPDLPAHIEAIADRLGPVSLVVTLDSGCGDYDRLWVTTSLRGLAAFKLTVEVLTEGVHSGRAGGIVPSSFRILRQILSRIEDERTGEVLLPALHAEVPADREAQHKAAGPELGDLVWNEFPFVEGVQPLAGADPVAQLRNREWLPSVEVTGMDDVPPTASAGNVLRPRTAAKVSVRLPPTCDVDGAIGALRDTLTADPPSGARVTFDLVDDGPGWNAPTLAPWLEEAADAASQRALGRPAGYIGEGGTIPFMGMLGTRFPDAQFLITGVLGPHSNAHGPNEFLHMPMARAVTSCVAEVLDAHARRS